MKKLFVMILMATLSFSVLASGDHDSREAISGSGFEMSHVKNIIVGTFNDYPVWADKKCGSHIRGQYRKTEDETKTFKVEKLEEGLGGLFNEKKTLFAGLDRENQVVKLKSGEKIIEVNYTTDSYDSEEGHYYGINFIFTNNGKDYNVRLDGEGCLGSIIYYSLFFYGMTTI